MLKDRARKPEILPLEELLSRVVSVVSVANVVSVVVNVVSVVVNVVSVVVNVVSVVVNVVSVVVVFSVFVVSVVVVVVNAFVADAGFYLSISQFNGKCCFPCSFPAVVLLLLFFFACVSLTVSPTLYLWPFSTTFRKATFLYCFFLESSSQPPRLGQDSAAHQPRAACSQDSCVCSLECQIQLLLSRHYSS